MSEAKTFDKLLERTTSPFLLEIDWDSTLRICDLIRQNDVQPKYALTQIKKKLASDNIHVLSFALECLESMVKNCGSKIHQEVAQKDFMELLKTLCQQKPDPVKSKILELIQCWSHAFKKNPNYRIVEDFYNQMKMEGFQFQPLRLSEAMFNVEEAPLWIQDSESTSCFRCRAEFGPIRRRHHCRACGQIFCHACSSKQASIPKFGIEKEVRVCDACFDKLKSSPSSLPSSTSLSASSTQQIKSQPAKNPQEKSEEEFQEELQLALALSQSEAEAKNQQKNKSKSLYFTQNNKTQNNSKQSLSSVDDENSNYTSNLSKSSSTASAPYLNDIDQQYTSNLVKEEKKTNEKQIQSIKQTNLVDEKEQEINIEIDNFIAEFKKILELYLNRMKADSIRGRSITNDTAVQSLFLQLQNLHPKLLSLIKYKEDERGYYESLQDKLTQLKDAREALNLLRQENYEKKKLEFEEKERLRQIQIAQKLQYMRQQKQSYFLYQQQLNLQKLQEQEKSLQMRLNEQREMVFKRELYNTAPTASAVNFNLPANTMISQPNLNPMQAQMIAQPNIVNPSLSLLNQVLPQQYQQIQYSSSLPQLNSQQQSQPQVEQGNQLYSNPYFNNPSQITNQVLNQQIPQMGQIYHNNQPMIVPSQEFVQNQNIPQQPLSQPVSEKVPEAQLISFD